MLQLLADLFLAPETLEKDHVTLSLYARNLKYNLASGTRVPATKDGGHTAVRYYESVTKMISSLDGPLVLLFLDLRVSQTFASARIIAIPIMIDSTHK